MSDPIRAAAQFLLDHLQWARHQQFADELFTEIAAAARVVTAVARGPAAQRYLGPCGAEIDTTGYCDCTCHTGPYAACDQPGGCGTTGAAHRTACDGDIYAREGALVGRCRTCGAEVASEDRRAWLDAEVRSHAFRAIHIAQAYGINVKTLRGWATERPEVRNPAGKLIRSATPARLRVHGHDLDGQPLFLVGDVLDLAAADAARRAETQSRRARRKETAA